MSTDVSNASQTDLAGTDDSPKYGYDSSDLEGGRSADDLAKQYTVDMGDDDDIPSTPGGDKSASDRGGDGSASKGPAAISRSDWADYGLTEAQARDLDSKGSLGTMLDFLDARARSISQQNEPPATPQPQGQAAPPAAQQASPPAAPAAGELKLDLDPELYDEGLIENMSKIVDHVNRVLTDIHGMKESVSGFSDFVTTQADIAFAQRMDGYFDGLGADYAEVVGKGPISSLAQGSPEATLREETSVMMKNLVSLYQQERQRIPSEKVLFERAFRIVSGDKVNEVARKQVADQVRNARGQFAAKPTHREGRPMSGSELAAHRAEQFYRERGL